MNTIAIVGASLAGLRGAESLRSAGFAGTLHLIGAESHLPYDRPPLSKEVLRGDWEPEQASLVKEGALERLDLELHLGRRAISLDSEARRVELGDGESISFDGMLIATGAAARSLPGSENVEGVHTLRTLDDCLAIRGALERSPRVAIVGAGFIGAEVAASCRQLGLDVSMIEMLPVPLEPAVGRDVGETLAALHRDHGVDLRVGVGVTEILGSPRVEGLRLSDGSEVRADLVVVGIGVVPETGWLARSGVAVDNGVLCDATCTTSVPGIVAAGDVARWPHPLFGENVRIEHWSNATEQAMAAANTLLAGPGNGEPYASVPFFWSDQYDRKIQCVGRCAGADQIELVQGSLAERQFLQLYGKAGKLVGALAINEPRRLIKCRRALRQEISFEEAVAKLGA